jgi:isopentenyl diphosphate isomerase/L-lactate dehydrogenase-like FMN-dependent dehydrogenase
VAKLLRDFIGSLKVHGQVPKEKGVQSRDIERPISADVENVNYSRNNDSLDFWDRGISPLTRLPKLCVIE